MSLGHRWSKHQTLHLWLVARETVIIILFPKNLNVYAVGNIEIRHNGGRQSRFAGNSALLPSDVMDFAILPAKRFWRETVWLLDVMHVTLRLPMGMRADGKNWGLKDSTTRR